MLPMTPDYVDAMAELYSQPLKDFWQHLVARSPAANQRPQAPKSSSIHLLLLDDPIVHYIIHQIAGAVRYAILATDYFGGIGDQVACVYEGGVLLPNTGYLRVNEALQYLGVQKQLPLDEFDTVGLGQYRGSDKYFDDEKYSE